jgi:hypothetical protein
MDKEEIKKSSEFEVQKSVPYQMDLWECFGEEKPSPPENLTFSVQCIDDWPLVSMKTNQAKDLNPIVTQSKNLEVTAPPGYYREGKKAKGSFVGEHEWKLFIVLRRMALISGGYQLDGKFALSFTLRELARFYKESTGKTVKHDLIRQRLEILRTAVYQIQDKDQTAHFSLLRELFIATRDELKKNGSAKCYVMFDQMTEKTLTSGNGVLIDYDLACKLPHIASWIYSKLERAGLETGLEAERPYKLWLKDTLYRVGLDNSNKTINVLKKEATKGLIELMKIGILRSFNFKDKTTSGRGRPKLLDSELSMEITSQFASRIKAKLWSTKKLREGNSSKISTSMIKENSLTSLEPLDPIKTETGYVGHYKRSEENDSRRDPPIAPVDGDWRESDRRPKNQNPSQP